MNQWLIAALLLFQIGAAGHGEEWAQFRGPGGRGVSEESGFPVRWSKSENVRWITDLPGRGLSAPVISRGRVYITACTGFMEDRLHVLCFAMADGKRLWERQLWATGNTLCHPKTCMAAATPATDGERIFALFATGDLACFSAEGNLLWYRALARDYPTIGNNVGMAASLVLWNDLIILPMENVGESFIAGIDKFTGVNRWRSDRPRDINWVTPLVINHTGQAQLVVQSGKEIAAYDPLTGRKVWGDASGGFSTAASPVAGEGLLFVSKGDLVALRPATDMEPVKELWHANKLKTTYSSALYYDHHVYVINSAGVLNCADATNGKLVWQQRLNNKGTYWACPVAADGKLYLINEAGVGTVVQSGPEPRIKSVNELSDTILATPSLAEKAIFLRSDKHLYCFSESTKK